MQPSIQPIVGVIAATREELEQLRPALELLDRLGCPYQALIANPMISPRTLLDAAEHAQANGCLALIASAGTAPQLPTLLAAAGRLPVIAVPPAYGSRLDDFGAGPPAPVAAVTAGDAQQAALFALRIAALVQPQWKKILDQYHAQIEADEAEANRELREEWLLEEGEETEAPPPLPKVKNLATERNKKVLAPVKEKVDEREEEVEFEQEGTEGTEEDEEDFEEDNEDEEEELGSPRLKVQGEEPKRAARFIDSDEPVEVRPVSFDKPLSGPVVGSAAAAEAEAAPIAAAGGAAWVREPRMLGRRRIDPDTPEVDLIEEAVDCLLEGGVIALPTDTVYGIACDATNAKAVALLSEIKGRPPGKAVSLLVDSQKQLGFIACNLTTEIRRLTEAFWPGPLTILFQKRPGNFAHINPGEAVAVRLPDHSTPLAIMQALARPLAFTSAALPGSPEPLDARAVEELHGDRLHLILDGGPLPESPPSTVIDVTDEPFKILRHGAVSTAQLSAIVGEKLHAH